MKKHVPIFSKYSYNNQLINHKEKGIIAFMRVYSGFLKSNQ